jgi:hypothetical protein
MSPQIKCGLSKKVSPLSKQPPNNDVDRMCQLLEKHDHQLQMISDKIERLLKLKPQEDAMLPRPKMSSVETMTSFDIPSGSSTPLLKIPTIEEENSIEEGRLGMDESEDTFYNRMMDNVNDILLVQSKSESSMEDIGTETIYIKKLASKYCSERTIIMKEGFKTNRESEPTIQERRKIWSTSPSMSFASKNYLSKYNLLYKKKSRSPLKTKNQILDFDNIRQQPKFV